MNFTNIDLSRSIAVLMTAGTISLGAGMAHAETTLSVWGWDAVFNGAIMDKAIARFAGSRPDVSLEFSDFGKAPLEQKLQSQLASGSTDGLPDIVLIEDYAAQRFLQSFPGAFEPVGAHVDLSGMAPYKVALATLGGQAYSMPFDSGVAGLFYHRADLEAAGFTPDDLKDITWDRLIEIGKAVEEKTGKKFLVQDFSSADMLRQFLHSAGIWYFTEDGENAAEVEPRFRQVLEEYVKVMKSGIVQDAAGWAAYLGSFTNHEVTGVQIGAWITAPIKANADQAGQWAVAPFPRIDGVEGAVNASNVGGSSWYVMTDAPNKDVALDFLSEVWAKDVDFYADILAEQGAVGSLLAARESAAYQAPDAFFGGDKVWADFAQWLSEIPEVNYGIFTAEAEAAFSAYFPDVIRGKMEFDDAMDAYIQRVNQQIQ